MNLQHLRGLKETVKTVVIAVLVAAIVAFVAGAKYQAGVDHTQAAQAAKVADSPKQ